MNGSPDWNAAYRWAWTFASRLGGQEFRAEVLMLLLRYGAGLGINDIVELEWRELDLRKRALQRNRLSRPLSVCMVREFELHRRYKNGPSVFHVRGKQRTRLSVLGVVQRPLDNGETLPIDLLIRAALGLDIASVREKQRQSCALENQVVVSIVSALDSLCTTSAAKDALELIEAEGRRARPNVAVIENALQRLQVLSREQRAPRKLRKILFDMLYDRDYWMRRKLAERNHNPLSMYRYGPAQVKLYSASAVGLYPYRN